MSAVAGDEATGRLGTRTVPGDVLLHAGPLLAALGITVNDLVLKRHFPGWLSGKLSDAGLCFLLPFLSIAAFEWAGYCAARVANRPWRSAGPAAIALASLLSAAYFAAQEVLPAFGRFHIALIQTLLPGRRVVLTSDTSDLGCLVFTAAAYFSLRRLRLPRPGAS